jgi:hypothetical protein
LTTNFLDKVYFYLHNLQEVSPLICKIFVDYINNLLKNKIPKEYLEKKKVLISGMECVIFIS